MDIKKIKISYALLLAVIGILGIKVVNIYAESNTNFSQTIDGNLGINIVDESGSSVAVPAVSFSSMTFSMNSQTSTGVLGTNAERVRVTNPTSSATWTASLAATNGPTTQWTGTDRSYDFNDSTAGATDGADADSVGGQMTINPVSGSIAGVGATLTNNVSLGASNAFAQGIMDSIDLMSAGAGAQSPGEWDLTGVGLSQSVPAGQAAQSYSIQMTLTVS